MNDIDGKIFLYETCIVGSRIEMRVAYAEGNWGKIKKLQAQNKIASKRIKELKLMKSRIEKINQIKNRNEH